MDVSAGKICHIESHCHVIVFTEMSAMVSLYVLVEVTVFISGYGWFTFITLCLIR
jgi:hypothetical protein